MNEYRLPKLIDCLQPVIALADHAVVVDNDPKLDLNTHALPKD